MNIDNKPYMHPNNVNALFCEIFRAIANIKGTEWYDSSSKNLSDAICKDEHGNTVLNPCHNTYDTESFTNFGRDNVINGEFIEPVVSHSFLQGRNIYSGGKIFNFDESMDNVDKTLTKGNIIAFEPSYMDLSDIEDIFNSVSDGTKLVVYVFGKCENDKFKHNNAICYDVCHITNIDTSTNQITLSTSLDYIPTGISIRIDRYNSDYKYNMVNGTSNVTMGDYTNAFGESNVNVGSFSTCFGKDNRNFSLYSNIRGLNNIGISNFNDINGVSNRASGIASNIKGVENITRGNFSTAIGVGLVADNMQVALGRYNRFKKIKPTDDGEYIDKRDLAVTIGAGCDEETSDGHENCVSVDWTGKISSNSCVTALGSNYAMSFMWTDSNTGKEDRAGLFVSLCANYPTEIEIYNNYSVMVLGVVTLNPGTVVDCYENTSRSRRTMDNYDRTKYTKVFQNIENLQEDGRGIRYHIEVPELSLPNQNENTLVETDIESPSIAQVCLLGSVVVRQDGTCDREGCFCKPNSNGVATKSSDGKGYIVQRVISDELVRIFFK